MGIKTKVRIEGELFAYSIMVPGGRVEVEAKSDGEAFDKASKVKLRVLPKVVEVEKKVITRSKKNK